MRLVWTRLAIADLAEAREYIAADNPAAAARLAARVVEAVRALLAAPQLGHVGAIRETREWHVGQTPYRVIYRLRQPRVEILRVLHERRQWPASSPAPPRKSRRRRAL